VGLRSPLRGRRGGQRSFRHHAGQFGDWRHALDEAKFKSGLGAVDLLPAKLRNKAV